MHGAEEIWNAALREAQSIHNNIHNPSVPESIEGWVEFFDLHWTRLDTNSKLLAITIIHKQGRQEVINRIKNQK